MERRKSFILFLHNIKQTLYAFLGNQAGKMLERPIIAAFGIRRKEASREFSAAQMIAQTIAAGSFPGTRLIRAIAVFSVFRLLAIHGVPFQQ
jgi:hypothetical protein